MTYLQHSKEVPGLRGNLHTLASQLQESAVGSPMNLTVRESLTGDNAEARYANYFHVGHNAYEVVLEFWQHYEGGVEPQMHTRIVTAPVNAKALLDLLKATISEYEKTFGRIDSRDAP